MSGKLIVLEGLDGCGKSTQFELLTEYFKKSGVNICGVSFPDYDSKSSALIKMYLAGEFGDSANDVNAYAASTFYAADRYASYKKYWQQSYNDGALILASRYTTSNIIYQMSKLDESERDGFIDWVFDYEYNRLGLPKPDGVIFLSLPIEVSQRLMTERYGGNEDRKDLHEKNISFLNCCRSSAEYAAKKLGWQIVDCSENGEIRSIEDINSQLREIIKRML